MNQEQRQDCAKQLFVALRERKAIQPLTDTYSDMSIEDAYHISTALLEMRKADGEVVIGKKIGITSDVVQKMLNVDQPDFGYLTDRMAFNQGAEMPISTMLMQPKAEGEIAFVLKDDLMGPGVTTAHVIAATDFVVPCFEIVDSRIQDWKIKIQDTVADNASCGLFVLGDTAVSPRDVDLRTCGMVVEKNGKVISTGAGAAALGSPVNAVAWLANTLGEYGIALKAGEIILSGSLVPLEPVQAGDYMTVSIGGIGSASVRFT